MNEKLKESLTQKNGSVLKLILTYAGSSFIATAIMAIYTLTDQIFVGKALGQVGLSAFGVASPIILMIAAIGTIFKVGGGEQISAALGKNDKKLSDLVVLNTYLTAIIFGILCFIISFLCIDKILLLLDSNLESEKEVVQLASSYLKIIFAGAPFFMFGYCSETFFRCIGKPMFALGIVTTTSVLNIILDAIFIFGLHMGMNGAAFATVLSQIIGMIIMLIYFISSKCVSLKGFRIQKQIIVLMIRIGIAFALSDIIMTVIEMLLNYVLFYYDAPNIIAALSVTSACLSILYIPLTGLDSGTQPLVSYCDAMGEKKKCCEIIRKSFFITFIFCVVTYIILMLFPNWIISWFLPSETVIAPEMALVLRITFAIQPTVAIYTSIMGTMAALGDEKYNLILSLLPIAFQIPLIFLLPTILPMPYIALNYTINDLLICFIGIWMITRFLKTKGYSLKMIFEK